MAWENRGLDWLLSPADTEGFLAHEFERRPFSIARGDEGYYQSLLDLQDVEWLAFSQGATQRPAWFKLVKDGWGLRPPTDQLGELRPSEVAAAYHFGYTLFLGYLHKRVPSVGALTHRLELDFVERAHLLLKGDIDANLYLTPAHARGFKAHYDHHDVFLLQLEGAKRWVIYEELQPAAIESRSSIPREDLGPVTLDVELRAGDLLYLPRGFPHEGETTASHSLHLTLGIESCNWLDLLVAVMSDDPAFRRSIAVGTPVKAETGQMLRVRVLALMEHLASGSRLADTFAELTAAKLSRFTPPAGRWLSDLTRLDAINLSTILSTRHGERYQILVDEGSLHLAFPGNQTTYLPAWEAALRWLIAVQTCSVDSIVGLSSSAEQLRFARRLVADGVLVVQADPTVKGVRQA